MCADAYMVLSRKYVPTVSLSAQGAVTEGGRKDP